MKIFNTFALIALSMTFGLAATQSLSAQYYTQGDPMQSMIDSLGNPEQEIQNILNGLGQQQNQLVQQMASNERRIINDWRRMTGDYQSSDQVVLTRSMQMARRQNPRAFARLDASHKARMAQIRKFGHDSTQIANTYSEISDMNHRGYMERSAAQDIGRRNFINGINETSDYVNLNGGRVNLSWNQPGQFQTDGSNTYYTDQNNNQWQHQGGDLWQQLDSIK